jgi:hypothetical protein
MDTHPAGQDRSTSAEPTESASAGVVWFLAMLGALVIYVLSVGPVARVYGGSPPAAVDTIYTPLAYLYRHVPAVHSFYDWYAKLWGVTL